MAHPFDRENPLNKLKKKIGDVNLREILQPDVVQQAQQVIIDRKSDFLEWTAENLKQMEESYYHLTQQSDDPNTLLDIMARNADSLRDRSGTFGYQLGSDIAKSLSRYCAATHAENPQLAIICRKHLDGLQIVFKDNVTDSGGAIGMELLQGLRLLVEKYPPA
jgi:glucosamine 6-phosphate synthetase-like amidotransferase/phosphosugar isomerase protein